MPRSQARDGFSRQCTEGAGRRLAGCHCVGKTRPHRPCVCDMPESPAHPPTRRRHFPTRVRATPCDAAEQCRRIFRHTVLDALEQCRRVAIDVPDISALVYRGDARCAAVPGGSRTRPSPPGHVGRLTPSQTRRHFPANPRGPARRRPELRGMFRRAVARRRGAVSGKSDGAVALARRRVGFGRRKRFST